VHDIRAHSYSRFASRVGQTRRNPSCEQFRGWPRDGEEIFSECGSMTGQIDRGENQHGKVTAFNTLLALHIFIAGNEDVKTLPARPA